MPKVSVVIPIYGVEKYLREALDSVLNQTLQDLEIILVDDGGKDSCPQIIDEYAHKDSRIIAIHKENSGYGNSMNIGLEKATGEYVAILEPDDFIKVNMYEDLYNIAKEYDSDIVKSGYYENLQCKENSKIKKIKWDNTSIPLNRSFTIEECGLFLYYHPSIWTCIYKKDFLDNHNIRFIEAPGAGWTDNPFQVQTMCLAERINYTPEAYYYWRRLNANHSDELKDYKLPFLRSEEIYAWLEKNNIINTTILNNIARRELAYIGFVLGMKEISDVKDCFSRIKALCLSMAKNLNVIFSAGLGYKEKTNYLLYLYCPFIIYYFNKLFGFRRKFVMFRWNKRERLIKIAGRILYQRDPLEK